MKYNDILKFARTLRKKQTPAETFFWEKVRNRKLLGKKFKRQQIIEYSNIMDNPCFFIVDFYCYEKKLIVEIDGSIHQEQKQQTYDQNREELLSKMGYVVLRFRNEDVLSQWESVESQLKKALE